MEHARDVQSIQEVKVTENNVAPTCVLNWRELMKMVNVLNVKNIQGEMMDLKVMNKV